MSELKKVKATQDDLWTLVRDTRKETLRPI